jgi:hypothetical protein
MFPWHYFISPAYESFTYIATVHASVRSNAFRVSVSLQKEIFVLETQYSVSGVK